jgi:hypothetical protein
VKLAIVTPLAWIPFVDSMVPPHGIWSIRTGPAGGLAPRAAVQSTGRMRGVGFHWGSTVVNT